MKQCEFCEAPLLDEAQFCGRCGQTPSRAVQQFTSLGDLPTLPLRNVTMEGTPTSLTPWDTNLPRWRTPIPDNEEDDDDEEKRRRAALFGFGLPLLGELANQPPPGQVPLIQGTPNVGQVPMLSNAPAPAGTPFAPGSAAVQANPGSAVVQESQPPYHPGHVPPHHPSHIPTHPLPHPQNPKPPKGGPGGTTGGPAGCLTIGVIILAALIIIASTFIGLSFTILAPNLSLSGNSAIAPGGNMTLHGSGFLPNSNVTLTLDNTIPLYVSGQPAPWAHTDLSRVASTGLLLRSPLSSTLKNVIPVNGDGTFNLTFQANLSWSLGKHVLQAVESVSHRRASISFTITQGNAPATPTDTSTPTGTPTGTPTSTPTTGPKPALSCVTPGTLALGPVREGNPQAVSGVVTLCTSGSGTLDWKASWNQGQAPWLQLDHTSGSIQAPNQITITVSASASALGAGTYKTTLTFSSTESNTTQTVNVTLTVAAGCISATPQQLDFVGVEGHQDPSGPQNITITNCGLTSDWSAHITNGSNWLGISPNQGTLQTNATGTITVTASNLQAGLKAGTYQDTITISLSGHTTTVAVQLTVQSPPPPPMISASPDPLNSTCSSSSITAGLSCTVTLTNSSGSSALHWQSSTSDQRVSMASNGTIAAGGQQNVTVFISSGQCPNITITFTGPANSASVTWDCPPPTISASPDPLNSTCSQDPSGNGNTDCTVTLSNSSSTVALSWSGSADTKGVKMQTSGTIPAGGQQMVSIVIARGVCTNITFTFTGPANSATVVWDCQLIS